MPSRRHPRPGSSFPARLARAAAIPLALAAAVAAVIALCSPAGAVTPVVARHPRLVHTLGTAIEDLAPYVPQDSCDPRAKRGTTELAALLTRTYPGIGSGSYRPCDGSVSEHHDGRAIDWMASIRVPWQHRDARALIDWLLATDAHGNRFAMARRLGVMYLIYDGRMWGAWSGTWQEYDGCLTTTKLQARSYDDYCHRSHVHISLSWNGARGRTSFWTGLVRPTDYGPCRPRLPSTGTTVTSGTTVRYARYAPVWTAVNLVPCP